MPARKDFLSILDLDHASLDALLTLARRMKADRAKGPKAPTATALSSLHVALLFEKPSLRTRSTSLINAAGLDMRQLLASNPKAALKKDDDERMPIHWAASNSHNEIVDILLQVRGFDVDEADGSGWTVLHIAASTGNDSLVEKLIKRGADINQKSEQDSILKVMELSVLNLNISR